MMWDKDAQEAPIHMIYDKHTCVRDEEMAREDRREEGEREKGKHRRNGGTGRSPGGVCG